MRKTRKDNRSLDEILQSTSDVLFPGDPGDPVISIDTRGTEGDTPLHVMLWRNDTHGALLLIESGADVNAIGDMDETPLHVAIRQENARAASALIDAGAKQDLRSAFGMTAQDMLREASPAFRKAFDRRRGV